MLTVVILTRNETDNIQRCIASALFADEIILVDNSTDDTIKLAKQIAGNKLVVYHDTRNNNFAALRNLALEKAKGKWVLFLDADEEIGKTLQQEILSAIQNTTFKGFYLKRQDYFLGRWLAHGESAQVRLLKLGQKTAGKWTRSVHEVWSIAGPTKLLQTPLLHYPHPTVAEFLERINRWTDLDAREFYTQGKKVGFWQMICFPVGKFIQNYFIRLGFLDGMPGLIMAVMMSMHSFLTRGKLYMLKSV